MQAETMNDHQRRIDGGFMLHSALSVTLITTLVTSIWQIHAGLSLTLSLTLIHAGLSLSLSLTLIHAGPSLSLSLGLSSITLLVSGCLKFSMVMVMVTVLVMMM